MNKKFYSALAGLFIVASSVLALNGFVGSSLAQTIDNDPDCDTVAIIKCGVFTQPNLRAAAVKGDVPKVYAALGVNQSDLGGMENGIVWKDGRVTIGDTVVATGATTAGRWNNPTSDMKSIAGTDRAFVMSTSHFVTDGQTAFVKMENGQFKFAVIKSCGNPVKATPKPQPKPPVTPPPTKPQPPKPPAETPVFACEELTSTPASSEDGNTSFRFDAKASASGGAKISKYTFDFGDGNTAVMTTSGLTTFTNHTYADMAKTYTARVTVTGDINGQMSDKTAPGCVTTVTVKEKPTPPPTTKPTFQCDSLKANLIDETNHTYSYTLKFTAKDGASFDSADFDFGDGATQNGVTESNLADVQHTYTTSGMFTTTATVHFTVEGSAQTDVSDTCSVKVEIPAVLTSTTPPPAAPTPETPPTIASTGPVDLAAGGLGLSSVAGATYYWRASRRNLINKLLGH